MIVYRADRGRNGAGGVTHGLLRKDGEVIRTGLQIPSFSFPGVEPADLFERVASIATTAEDSGFDSVFVMPYGADPRGAVAWLADIMDR